MKENTRTRIWWVIPWLLFLCAGIYSHVQTVENGKRLDERGVWIRQMQEATQYRWTSMDQEAFCKANGLKMTDRVTIDIDPPVLLQEK